MTESFIDKFKKLCVAYSIKTDGFFMKSFLVLWKEHVEVVNTNLKRIEGCLLLPQPLPDRLCLQCGRDVPVGANGLCSDCVEALIREPRTKVNLEEG